MTSDDLKILATAREHDASHGEGTLPRHYQAQIDRRELLRIIDELRKDAR